ncbi:sensor histidine kinase [Kitasatospora sp. NPDC056184]|uniref:sensor histidine kinase n=1 Tax=Kitasatospora sp. NPDC056184 TaxID=3345738 RepID=UPI0035E23306
MLAREEERRRLRHDLHDGLGPALSGLRLRIDAAGADLPGDSGAADALTAASAGIGLAIAELRRITHGLNPGPLDSEGLTDGLRRLADTLGSRSLHVTLDLRPDPLPALSAAVEVAVYRISGEALNNVVRHSGATAARLSLGVLPDRVTVEVADNGTGFPVRVSTPGVGLRSMAERAEELGGTFTAGNAPVGAVVRAVFPRGRAD